MPSTASPYLFWGSIFIANVIFFLVPYGANFKNEPNPFGFMTKKMSLRSVLILPYVKNTSDPFKVNFEYTLFVLVVSVLGLTSVAYFHLGATIGLFTFVSICYYGIMVHVFQKQPFLKGDIAFAKVGISILEKYKLLLYVGLLALLVGLYFVFFEMTEFLLALPANKTMQMIVACAVTLLGLRKVHKTGYRMFQNRTVLSSVGYLYRNLKYSNKYHYLTQKTEAYYDDLNIYKNIKLATKPNVNILCIESYGSLYFRNLAIAKDKNAIFSKYESALTEKGYYIATGYSKPPQFAGGSWKSYSSLNFGIKLLDDGLYFTLFNNAEGFKNYQSLQGYLRSQGYYNYALAALQPNKEEKVDWEHIRRSFDSDKIIDWDTIGYKGKTIKFFSVRDIAPDQYALHRAQEYITTEGKEVYSLFNISLNSHYPFQSPETLVEDWKSLQEVESKMILKDLAIEGRYAKCIQYQLDNTIDLISKNADQEGVYIVFGDHQPPFITDEKYGFETPMHIITKSKQLLEPFLAQGFLRGMTPPDQENGAQIKHEGFYSLFMQGLNKVYGKNPEMKLPYLPDGVIFEDKIEYNNV